MTDHDRAVEEAKGRLAAAGGAKPAVYHAAWCALEAAVAARACAPLVEALRLICDDERGPMTLRQAQEVAEAALAAHREAAS